MLYDPYVYRLPPQAYTPSIDQALAVVTMRDLSREYVRLRGMAVKGGTRLRDAGYRAGQAFTFPTLTELKAGDPEIDPDKLQKQLARLAEYISNPERTVTGRKKAHLSRQVAALQDGGYDFIDSSNINEFGRFMEGVRAQYGSKFLASDEAATLFELVEKASLDPDEVLENFEIYLDGINEAYDILEKWDNDKPVSAEEVRKRMGVD